MVEKNRVVQLLNVTKWPTDYRVSSCICYFSHHFWHCTKFIDHVSKLRTFFVCLLLVTSSFFFSRPHVTTHDRKKKHRKKNCKNDDDGVIFEISSCNSCGCTSSTVFLQFVNVWRRIKNFYKRFLACCRQNETQV